MLRQPYRPRHGENRMRHEGNVARAREQFLAGRAPENLRHLLAGRYLWMNEFIRPGDVGLEVGCGTGLSKEFIRAKEFFLSDFDSYDWLDSKNINALATPFDDAAFDFVVNSNMIHHVPSPLAFFEEMHRILRPGGSLIIQEINASLLMRLLLRVMRHEGYSFNVDVFDPKTICTDASDLWSANCAIPNLLFDDLAAFQRQVPGFRLVTHRYRECLTMVNSGGVIAKTVYVPLPRIALRLIGLVDAGLVSLLPEVFAMQRQIVLQKSGKEALCQSSGQVPQPPAARQPAPSAAA